MTSKIDYRIDLNALRAVALRFVFHRPQLNLEWSVDVRFGAHHGPLRARVIRRMGGCHGCAKRRDTMTVTDAMSGGSKTLPGARRYAATCCSASFPIFHYFGVISVIAVKTLDILTFLPELRITLASGECHFSTVAVGSASALVRAAMTAAPERAEARSRVALCRHACIPHDICRSPI
jgi:hypothetical protein